MSKFKENDLVYTQFGYGTLTKIKKINNNGDNIKENENLEENNMLSIKASWGGEIHLLEKLVKKKIKINIKTFFGNRKKFNFEVEITTSMQTLKNLLINSLQENEKKSFYNLRLIHPMGFIRELSVSSYNLENYKIPNEANLILLVQTTFFWDVNFKGNGIKLSNNNLTANKNGESDYQTILGNLPFSSGRHYWEIKIDKFIDEEDIFIGIAKKEINLYVQPTTSNCFWGYLCLCGKKFSTDGNLIDYGSAAKIGDIIGILLEFNSGIGSLSFYKNGTKYGVAFNNLMEGTYFPALCMFYGEVQATLDPKAQMPLN